MKNLAIIIPPQRLDASALAACMGIWQKRLNLRVFSINALQPESYSGNLQAEALNTLDSNGFDGVAVMPGTGTKEFLWDDPEVIAQLQLFDRARKLVAGLGLGAVVLAQSGILLGKKAATNGAVELSIQLKSYGAIFVPTDVVKLKWVITGSGADVEAFAHAVSDWLCKPSR
jgi:putative intracellular protease/amidase